MVTKRLNGFSPLIVASLVVCAVSALPASAATYTVDVQNFSFTPADIALTSGDIVHFVWVSGFHTATSGSNCTPDNVFFDHAVDPNNLTFDFVVPTGTTQIPYFCRFHCAIANMVGAINIFPLGDMNCDGVVNFADINPFVLALSDPAGYMQQFPTCNINLADVNRDGVVDFADINPFVALLSGGI